MGFILILLQYQMDRLTHVAATISIRTEIEINMEIDYIINMKLNTQYCEITYIILNQINGMDSIYINKTLDRIYRICRIPFFLIFQPPAYWPVAGN